MSSACCAGRKLHTWSSRGGRHVYEPRDCAFSLPPCGCSRWAGSLTALWQSTIRAAWGAAGHYNLTSLALTFSSAHHLGVALHWRLMCVCRNKIQAFCLSGQGAPRSGALRVPRGHLPARRGITGLLWQAHAQDHVCKVRTLILLPCLPCLLLLTQHQRQDVSSLAPTCRELLSLEYLQAWAQICNHTLCMVVCLLLHSGEIPIASPSAALLFATYLHTFDQARCLTTTLHQS